MGCHRGNAGQGGVVVDDGRDGGGATRRSAVRRVLYFSILRLGKMHCQLTHLGRGKTGGARRRQATIGCGWGVGVATVGGSSAWTMLPDVKTWRTKRLVYESLLWFLCIFTRVGSSGLWCRPWCPLASGRSLEGQSGSGGGQGAGLSAVCQKPEPSP